LKTTTKPIVALKSVRVGDFNGKNLSTLSSSRVMVEPNIPETAWLRNWYNSSGVSSVAAPLSERGAGGGRQDRRVTFAQVKDEGIGTTNGPEWVAVSWVYKICKQLGVGHFIICEFGSLACIVCYSRCPCDLCVFVQNGSSKSQ
jgi:hypothetical protein